MALMTIPVHIKPNGQVGCAAMGERLFPLGASTLGYRFDSLAVALREIAGQGFDLVDIAMIPGYCPHFNPVTASTNELDALQEQLEDLGLRVATLNVSHGLFGNPTAREGQMAFVRASLR